MAAKRRYYSDDDHIGKTPSALKRLGRARQREYLLYWFHRNFEDPAQKTPYESAEGGYQYIWGGPYDANDELGGEFGDIVSEDLLSEVAEEVEGEGIIDWAPGPAHSDMQQRQEDAEAEEDERSDEQPRWRQTQGVIIASLHAGESAGKPLQEPAHVTPKFPRGIKNSDLRHTDGATQRETALWWFLLNLEPYDHSRAAAHFGTARFGDPFSRIVVQAQVILQQEFAGILPDEMIGELGHILAGDWMWKSQPVQSLVPPSTTAEVMTAVVPVLESLADAIQYLARPAAHGSIGHNGPPDECALTEEERQEVLEEIAKAQDVAKSSDPDAPSKVLRFWKGIKEKLTVVEKWALDRLNEFSSEAAKEAGKAVGKWVPASIAAHVTIYSLVKAADQIIASLHLH